MNSGFESLGRLRAQALVLLALVFVIGMLSGVATDRLWLQNPKPMRPHGPPHGLPPFLKDGLDLTADQNTKIQAIIEGSRSRTDAVFEEVMPRLRTITDSVRVEIRAVLTPEQQKVFDERQPPFFREGGAFRGGPPPRLGPPPGHRLGGAPSDAEPEPRPEERRPDEGTF